jgi:hypothetical protein
MKKLKYYLPLIIVVMTQWFMCKASMLIGMPGIGVFQVHMASALI